MYEGRRFAGIDAWREKERERENVICLKCRMSVKCGKSWT
jgi:hypothetical protein